MDRLHFVDITSYIMIVLFVLNVFVRNMFTFVYVDLFYIKFSNTLLFEAHCFHILDNTVRLSQIAGM